MCFHTPQNSEQLFSSIVITEKHLYEHDQFHNFIDFNKAFDRVWLADMWQVLRSFCIEEGLVQVVQVL